MNYDTIINNVASSISDSIKSIYISEFVSFYHDFEFDFENELAVFSCVVNVSNSSCTNHFGFDSEPETVNTYTVSLQDVQLYVNENDFVQLDIFTLELKIEKLLK